MRLSILIILGSLLLSCNEVNNIDLIGKWRAIQVLEEGKPLAVDIKEIQINFKPTYYEYTSTLKYKEAGNYRIQANLLYTRDTLKVEGVEKAVAIAKITPDSLFLRMNEKGKERILKLVRSTEAGE